MAATHPIEEVLAALGASSVRYLVVGGVADIAALEAIAQTKGGPWSPATPIPAGPGASRSTGAPRPGSASG